MTLSSAAAEPAVLAYGGWRVRASLARTSRVFAADSPLQGERGCASTRNRAKDEPVSILDCRKEGWVNLRLGVPIERLSPIDSLTHFKKGKPERGGRGESRGVGKPS